MIGEYQQVYRKIMMVLIDLLGNIGYTNNENKNVPVRVIPGSHEKIVHDYLYNTNRTEGNAIQNILPCVTVMIENVAYDNASRINKIQSIELQNGMQYSPVPIVLTFRGGLHAHKLNVLFQMMEQLQLLFDPTYAIDIRYFNNMEPISAPISMTIGGITHENEYDVNGERLISCEFSIILHCNLFKNVVYNERKIELNLSIGDTITITPNSELEIGSPIYREE